MNLNELRERVGKEEYRNASNEEKSVRVSMADKKIHEYGDILNDYFTGASNQLPEQLIPIAFLGETKNGQYKKFDIKTLSALKKRWTDNLAFLPLTMTLGTPVTLATSIIRTFGKTQSVMFEKRFAGAIKELEKRGYDVGDNIILTIDRYDEELFANYFDRKTTSEKNPLLALANVVLLNSSATKVSSGRVPNNARVINLPGGYSDFIVEALKQTSGGDILSKIERYVTQAFDENGNDDQILSVTLSKTASSMRFVKYNYAQKGKFFEAVLGNNNLEGIEGEGPVRIYVVKSKGDRYHVYSVMNVTVKGESIAIPIMISYRADQSELGNFVLDSLKITGIRDYNPNTSKEENTSSKFGRKPRSSSNPDDTDEESDTTTSAAERVRRGRGSSG